MTTHWLPTGLHELAATHGAVIDRTCDAAPVGDASWWVDLPERVVDEPTRPAEPVPLGGGYLSVDLGPDDAATWESFRAVASRDRDPESFAARAQVWRLPVAPYRRQPGSSFAEVDPEPMGQVDLRGARIVDLTSMWAGPLCTELLGRAGATVLKIEPSARPDGLRWGDGDDGSGRAPMFMELNKAKEILDLDLRHCSHGGEFDRILRSADLVVTSLSNRALANLGMDAASLSERHPGLRTLAITAFDEASPEADWVAYGTGVHATSGLGWVGECPVAPAFSYPDPIAGLLACRTALAQLTDSAPRHSRVSLAGAIAPLADIS